MQVPLVSGFSVIVRCGTKSTTNKKYDVCDLYVSLETAIIERLVKDAWLPSYGWFTQNPVLGPSVLFAAPKSR